MGIHLGRLEARCTHSFGLREASIQTDACRSRRLAWFRCIPIVKTKHLDAGKMVVTMHTSLFWRTRIRTDACRWRTMHWCSREEFINLATHLMTHSYRRIYCMNYRDEIRSSNSIIIYNTGVNFLYISAFHHAIRILWKYSLSVYKWSKLTTFCGGI